MSAGEDPARPGLRAGTIGRPHGLDGSFHVGAVVPGVFGLIELGSEVQVGGRSHRVVRIAGHPGRPILRLEDAEDRTAAESLTGQDLFVARSAAPPLEQDEWWAEDLERCAVRDGERPVGRVTALLALPSCEVLEVRRDDGGAELLVPLISDAVRGVDLEAGIIDIDLRFLGEA